MARRAVGLPCFLRLVPGVPHRDVFSAGCVLFSFLVVCDRPAYPPLALRRAARIGWRECARQRLPPPSRRCGRVACRPTPRATRFPCGVSLTISSATTLGPPAASPVTWCTCTSAARWCPPGWVAPPLPPPPRPGRRRASRLMAVAATVAAMAAAMAAPAFRSPPRGCRQLLRRWSPPVGRCPSQRPSRPSRMGLVAALRRWGLPPALSFPAL